MWGVLVNNSFSIWKGLHLHSARKELNEIFFLMNWLLKWYILRIQSFCCRLCWLRQSSLSLHSEVFVQVPRFTTAKNTKYTILVCIQIGFKWKDDLQKILQNTILNMKNIQLKIVVFADSDNWLSMLWEQSQCQ